MGRRAVRAAVLAGGTLAVGLLLVDPVVRIAGTSDPPPVLEHVAWTSPGSSSGSGTSSGTSSGGSAALSRTSLLDGYGRPLTGGPGPGRSGSSGSSTRLVPPRHGGVDRGIADTGKHSPGDVRSCTCPQKYKPSSRVPISARTTGSGRVTVAWWHNGDPAAVSYRVGYQPQTWVRSVTDGDLTLPAFTWATVPPGALAGTRSWTLTTARPGTTYAFVLMVDVTTPETGRGATRMEIGRLDGVRVA